MEWKYLLYIGKGNKKYTHNKFYIFYGFNISSPFSDNFDNFTISIVDNKNNIKIYGERYRSYLKENFRLLNENDFKNHNRKMKINKLNNKK